MASALVGGWGWRGLRLPVTLVGLPLEPQTPLCHGEGTVCSRRPSSCPPAPLARRVEPPHWPSAPVLLPNRALTTRL